MRRPQLVLAALSLLLPAGGALAAAPTPAPPGEVVLSPEGNHLWAYDPKTGAHQLVFRAVNGADPGETPTSGTRDINGQICVSPDGKHVVTGEDTVVETVPGGDGGSSHDPRIAGWGYFDISGDRLSAVTVRQTGKLAPEDGRGPGYTGDPDNYGCGWLDKDRLFTTAIGNTLPGQAANGQLFLWFDRFTDGFGQETADGVSFWVGTVDHCVIDSTIATAGGIAIDGDGNVYVANNRPDDAGNPGGVYRYSGVWPRTWSECTPDYVKTHITKTRIVPGTPAGPVPDPRVLTPSAVVISPEDTLYVSSVASGTVSEFTKGGQWVRDIWPLAPVAPRTGPTMQTPYGLAVTGDGSLWIADLGVLLDGPVDGQGSLIRVGFDADRDPEPLGTTVRDGLTFPDGLGVFTLR